MSDARFDALARRVASRRSVLAGVAGLGLARPVVSSVAAKRKPRSCVGRPDQSPCGKGKRCSGNVCAKAPSCGEPGVGCALDAACCSADCSLVLGCGLSAAGQPCHQTSDCVASRCVGFVCCRAQGEACAVDADCCQGFCDNLAGSCDCLGPGENCIGGAGSCCSGRCRHNHCQ